MKKFFLFSSYSYSYSLSSYSLSSLSSLSSSLILQPFKASNTVVKLQTLLGESHSTLSGSYTVKSFITALNGTSLLSSLFLWVGFSTPFP